MRVQGSYTVEAALIMPIVLGCILLILSQTIKLYAEVTENVVYSSWWQEFEPAESFREIELMDQTMQRQGEEESWK